MRTLCYGGTFNPIHVGHLICARAAAERAGFDRVLLIPNVQSPLKSNDPDRIDPVHRVQMCRLAIEGNVQFEVDDLEMRRPPPSYTIDTIRELKRTRGWSEAWWLIGADTFSQLSKWHEPAALMRETHFLVMGRPGWKFDPSEIPNGSTVDAPLIEISSTDIRRRVREGKSIEYLVPKSVEEYIRLNRLYA